LSRLRTKPSQCFEQWTLFEKLRGMFRCCGCMRALWVSYTWCVRGGSVTTCGSWLCERGELELPVSSNHDIIVSTSLKCTARLKQIELPGASDIW